MEAKTCGNCKHRELSWYEHPCNTCPRSVIINAVWTHAPLSMPGDKWEAKEDD